ncbi:hypothetical protein BDW68DRAFT_192184 [Aspergillus falconensis]
MGGAATCLLSPDLSRRTEDVDLVIHVDHRMITADRLTSFLTSVPAGKRLWRMLPHFPADFEGVSQFGHTIPAYKLRRPGVTTRLVELEVFDHRTWLQRPQYNIQYQCQGSAKEATDIYNIINIILLAVLGRLELNFNQNQEPALAQTLKVKIKYSTIF